MVHRHRLATSLFGLMLVSGALEASEGRRPLPPTELAFIRAGHEGRVQGLGQKLRAKRADLRLPAEVDFSLLGHDTDRFGGTHARFQQTYKGVKVWGGRALGHMDANGGVRPFNLNLKQDLNLDVQPALSVTRILELAEATLPNDRTRAFAPSRAELTVLPSSEIDGLKLTRNLATNRMEVDPDFSVSAPHPRTPYVLAYFVQTSFVQKGWGVRSINMMLDANTGALLKKWDGMKYDTASKGLGHTQYSGDQTLDTLFLTDTSAYKLMDTTRPVKESRSMGLFIPGIGNQTLWADPSLYVWPYDSNTTNTWGDGLNYLDAGIPNDTNGETAAADAHFNIQVTWDMYAKVFGRVLESDPTKGGGIDGEGSAAMSIMHVVDSNFNRWANAQWDSFNFLMMYGDGDLSTVPGGMKSLTCMDVSAHEMSHGVMDFTAALSYDRESGGLNEANSDIFGTLAEFYAYGPSKATGPTIPDTGGDWLIGAALSQVPVRYMYKPSLDAMSYDAWFAGMRYDDVHFTSGPGNRFFYFLSNGTSATDPQKQSPYLPGGMTGLGNQKAGQIWYDTIAHQITDMGTDYAGMRVATLQAAAELFPDGADGKPSEEYKAVQNAWAAVNVGAAAGKPDPVLVTISHPQSYRYFFPDDHLPVAAGETAHMVATVANTTNTQVTWTLGGLNQIIYPEAGKISADGHFAAPIRVGAVFPITATSVADPLQHAVAFAIPVNMDLDDDTETDAIDMGQVALFYGYRSNDWHFHPNADLTLDNEPTVDDADVAMFVSTFLNTFGH